MAKTLDTDIELARWHDHKRGKITVTIEQYQNLLATQDRTKIADFIYHRLHSRYLKPFHFEHCQYKEEFKNGFSIMANCCLLIETLQSFKNGWGDSDKKSNLAFKQFFASELNFTALKEKAQDFYSNIRCGILHQGETTGGWRINRNGSNLFDRTNLIVDSIIFARELDVSLKKYSESLKTASWDSELWDNFRTKMRKIISNCER